MKIIPAIDIIKGKCVRLTQGDYSQAKIYNDDPLAVALDFEQAGIKYLHLVDLDGAKAGKVVNWNTIQNIAGNTSLNIDFGGGVKTNAEMQRLLSLGVKQINVGSIAVKNPTLVFEWLSNYGPDCILLSADVKDEIIVYHGWQQTSENDIYFFIQTFSEKGLQNVVCTDIGTDGMMRGPNLALYKKLIEEFPEMNIIASGGVSCMDDVRSLNTIGIHGVIIGKAIYEKKIKLSELVRI
ncbi:MAG TPA: 1-(5-phosphoribosyl)-5-[(5-phosphoribosylamino)methylideneamino]imidazole-4-carboxamide isomerase [Chryseosolibacter sp.]|nr:1-(5-phosphoribosyl)-5-[(5-phosphoribosylamino)methylideneamino]imidazole-4-carboxamide isomerase [Chryseosolibacter sp.]